MKYLALLFILASCASRPPCKGLTHNCNNGDGGACYNLGKAVFGTIGKDNPNNEMTKEKAAAWMKKGCSLGHDKSCFEFTQFQKYQTTKK